MHGKIIASFDFLIAMLPGYIIVLTGKLMPTFWKNRNVHIAGSGRSVKAKPSFETSEIIDQSIRRNCLKILGLETEDVCFEILRKVGDTTSRHDETSQKT
jgi:hypothetical protein